MIQQKTSTYNVFLTIANCDTFEMTPLSTGLYSNGVNETLCLFKKIKFCTFLLDIRFPYLCFGK